MVSVKGGTGKKARKDPKKSTVNHSCMDTLLGSLELPADLVGPDMKVARHNEAFEEEIDFLRKRKGSYKEANRAREKLLRDSFRMGRGGEVPIRIEEKGRGRTFLLIVSPYRSEEGIMMLEVWLDLSALEVPGGQGHQDRLYDEMLDTSNAMIIGLDNTGKVTMYNKGAQKALGYRKEDIIGTSWFDHMADQQTGKGLLEVFHWNISTGFRTRFENRIRSSSGDMIDVSWENTVLFDGEGDILMVLMVGQDITKMKALEESLVQRGIELERALEEASIYNDLMLHDIHNSTAAIMGYLELMSFRDLDPKKRSEYASMALKEVKKSASIIKEVKKISRLEPAKGPSRVRLPEVLSKLSEISTEGQGKELELTSDVSDLTVMADPSLEEAVIRIVEHLTDLRGGGGQIHVRARRSPALSRKLEQPVLITVTAPGLGFSSDMEGPLMKKRTEGSDTSSKLGLYLVKRIVERSGGQIWVDGDRSGNARFNILIKEAI